MIQIIVYSRATGFPRRVLDHGFETLSLDEAIRLANPHPGEAVTVYTKNPPRADGAPANALPHYIEHITRERGAPPSGYRHIEVDASGTVVGVHHADPACGDRPINGGVELVQHDRAHVGWKRVGDSWEAPK